MYIYMCVCVTSQHAECEFVVGGYKSEYLTLEITITALGKVNRA